MSDCVIREAVETDADALKWVSDSALATLRKTYRPRPETIASAESNDPPQTQLAALLDGKIVGSVVYCSEDERLHLLSLFVHEDYRQQGIAKRLIAKLVDVGKQLGRQRLSAYTVKETGIVNIFEQMGFGVVSEERTDLFESDHFDQLTAVYLERDID